ncbi:hypothetical protein MBLNU459_g3866t2 [Dothideomycetes sp. NU459]
MARFYAQSQIYDVPLPSADSLDSGYAGEDADPFDKGSRHQDVRGIDYQTSNLGQDRSALAAMEFNPNFSFMPPAPDRTSASFTPYQQLGFAAPYQPTFCVMDHSQAPTLIRNSPQLPMEDSISVKSEDGASNSSVSSTVPTFQGDDSQHQPQHSSLWGDNNSDMIWSAANENGVEKMLGNERSLAKQTPSRGRPRKRIPHTAVERRYRENLNMHLEKLRTAVPNLQAAQRRRSHDGTDALRPSKCEVLIGAVGYIKSLENENERLKKRMQQIKSPI